MARSRLNGKLIFTIVVVSAITTTALAHLSKKAAG